MLRNETFYRSIGRHVYDRKAVWESKLIVFLLLKNTEKPSSFKVLRQINIDYKLEQQQCFATS